jgi:pimeloyl-ACP methyl ester carboxylesterase
MNRTYPDGSNSLEEMMRAQTMQRARVNGVELEYDVTGEGEPVLLISPVLADAFVPILSEPSLARRYRLITYHKRGWVGSTHTPAPVSIADHAADAAALLDHLGVGRAHVAGHSSGAAVAAQLALRQPELVQTLALLELSLLSVPGAGAFLQKAGPAFEAYAAGKHETALVIFMNAVSGLEWDACRTLLDTRIPGAVAAAIKDADTFFGIELPALSAWTFGAAEAKGLSQPVLSVLGNQTEPLWVEIASALRSWLPQVEECTVEGAGHLLQIQRPHAVAQGLAGFFDRHRIAVA